MKKWAILLLLTLMIPACTRQEEEEIEEETLSAQEETESSIISDILGVTEDSSETDTFESNNSAWVCGSTEYTYLINYNRDDDIYEILKQKNDDEGEITILKTEKGFMNIAGGTDEPFYYPMLVKDRIYYFHHSDDEEKSIELCWINIDGSAEGIFPENELNDEYMDLSDKLIMDYGASDLIRDMMYSMLWSYSDGRILTETGVVVDLYDEELIFPEYPDTEKYFYMPCGLYKDSVYYLRGVGDDIYDLSNNLANGIYALDINTGIEREVCSIAAKEIMSLNYFVYAEDSMFYASLYDDEDYHELMTLHRIDLSSGEKTEVCIYSDSFAVGGGEIYYTRDMNLYSCDLSGENETLIAEEYGENEYKMFLAVSNGYIYYVDYGWEDPEYKRMSVNGKFFPMEYVHSSHKDW